MKRKWLMSRNSLVFLLLLVSHLVYAEKLVVYTVNYPLQYFAQRIGGEYISVHFPAPKNIDPAFWMPTAETINAYQQADLILLNGAGYAKWVNKVSLPRMRTVNTSKGFKDKYISIKHSVSHQHGPGGKHAHTGTAFTTWLDLKLAAEQARVIYQSLLRKRPEHEDTFKANYLALEYELLQLDKKLIEIIATDPSKRVYASHPVYQYFARRYGMDMNVQMLEPDVYPSAVQWNELTNVNNIKWMVWEDRPMDKTVKRLTELGISVITLKPCMNVPEEGDFISVMQSNIDELAMAYKLKE